MDTVQTATRSGREYVPHWRDVKIPLITPLAELLGEAYTPEVAAKFPDVMPPTYPTGINVVVQLRTEAKTKTLKGGQIFWLPDETIDANKARAQTGLVRAIGPSAYRHRQTLDLWPEGHWCVPGMFVRVPMYGGDRLEVNFQSIDDKGVTTTDFVLFATFKDQDCMGLIVGDPLTIKTG